MIEPYLPKVIPRSFKLVMNSLSTPFLDEFWIGFATKSIIALPMFTIVLTGPTPKLRDTYLLQPRAYYQLKFDPGANSKNER